MMTKNDEAMTLRETARGIAIRAGILTVGGILIGGWIVGVSMKIAGKAIHVLLLAGTALVLGGIATYEVRKHLPHHDEEPATGPRALVS